MVQYFDESYFKDYSKSGVTAQTRRWVSEEDYAALEAEVERLRAEIKLVSDRRHEHEKKLFHVKAELEAVMAEKAELERRMLEHAGMLLCEEHSNYWGEMHDCPCCVADTLKAENRRYLEALKDINSFFGDDSTHFAYIIARDVLKGGGDSTELLWPDGEEFDYTP